ncbi:cytochrome c oxidase subunit 2 precursor [mine drainage metagenome]|uniref:cytochrome-c oxidase n=1 Tax=mine drainage metagenome TaxID=410659 RepID=A0A1J5PQ68_9ZZZZ
MAKFNGREERESPLFLRVVPRPSRFLRPAVLGSMATVLVVALSGCSASSLPRLGLPNPATKEGHISLSLWQGAWIAALAVGALVWGLIIWAIIFHRRRGDHIPAQTKYNVPIEVLYTVIPFLIVAVLFFFTARDETKITAISKDSAAVHIIHVNGIRWSWQFTYEDLPSSTTVTGTPDQPPMLYLPLNEKVRFVITTSDVNHSFWVPAFIMKMDAIAGRTNQFEVTPDRLGTFAGKCAELCGRDHSRMLFNVKVVTAAEYQQRIAAMKGSAA